MPDHSYPPGLSPSHPTDDTYISPALRSRPWTQRSRPSASSIFQAPSRDTSESWRRTSASPPSSISSAYQGQALESTSFCTSDEHEPHQYESPSDHLIRSASDHQFTYPVNPNHLIQVKLPSHTRSHRTLEDPKDSYSFTQSSLIDPKDPSFASRISLGTHHHIYDDPQGSSFSPFSPAPHTSQLAPDSYTRYPDTYGARMGNTASKVGAFFRKHDGELPPRASPQHTPFDQSATPYDHGILSETTQPIPIHNFQDFQDDDITPTPSVKPLTQVASRRPPSPVYQPLQPSPRYSDPRDAYAFRHGAIDQDRYDHSRIGAPPTPPFGTSKTEPFTLDPPPYTDANIPLPEPYNRAYPHPLSAYASLGVNEETRRRSGYDKALWELWNSNPDKLRGTILSEAGRDDLIPPALTMLIFPGEGNGIPERLWSRFESFGAARVPVGVAGIPPSSPLPPRLASLNHSNSMTSITSTISAYRSLSAHPSLTGPMSKSAMTPEEQTPSRQDDYFGLSRVRHLASMVNLGTGFVGSMPPTPQQEPLTPSHVQNQDGGWYAESQPLNRVVPPLTPPPEPRQQVPSDVPAVQAYAHSPSPQAKRQNCRRASASPMDLHTVDEQHEPVSTPHSPASVLKVAPIGAERSTNHRSQSLSRRNGRSPDLATMAEYFASRPRTANVALGGIGIVELGQLYAQQPFVARAPPHRGPQTYSNHGQQGGQEPLLHVEIPARHGDLKPRASSSSLSSIAVTNQATRRGAGPDSNRSISTSMSSSQPLPTPISGSSWVREGDGHGSPAASLSGSLLNSGSFGLAYGKRVALEVKEGSSESNGQTGGPLGAKGQGKDGHSTTSWEFSTGKSIWC